MISNTNIKATWIDQTGFAASLLCAIHCAALPFALIAFPFISSGIIASIEFEWFMLALSGLLGYMGVRHGLRSHGVRFVLFLFLIGITFLLIARLYQLYELEVLKSQLKIQVAPYLQTFTPPVQSYHQLHLLSHKNITFSSMLSILGGVLIASSHIFNILYGHHTKKEEVNSNSAINAEDLNTNASHIQTKRIEPERVVE